MRLAVVVACLLAGCAGPANGPGADDGRQSADVATPDLAGSGDFVVDYTYNAQVCATGTGNYLRSQDTSTVIPRPANATHVELTFTWTPVSPLSDSMRFLLVDPDGRDTTILAEGTSPVVWELGPEHLQVTTSSPWVAGEPGDCEMGVAAGSSPQQAVHYEAVWR